MVTLVDLALWGAIDVLDHEFARLAPNPTGLAPQVIEFALAQLSIALENSVNPVLDDTFVMDGVNLILVFLGLGIDVSCGDGVGQRAPSVASGILARFARVVSLSRCSELFTNATLRPARPILRRNILVVGRGKAVSRQVLSAG